MRKVKNDTPENPFAIKIAPAILIGIDCGVNTGIAIWSVKEKKFLSITTTQIHLALDSVKSTYKLYGSALKVIVEDARQVRFKTNAAAAQGAGSVKRDATIWEDFLKDYGIPHEMVRPQKALTNYTSQLFAQYTGYTARTSTHARDAAMLVFKRTN